MWNDVTSLELQVMTGAKRFCKIVEWGLEIKKIGNQLVKRSPLLIVDVAETCF